MPAQKPSRQPKQKPTAGPSVPKVNGARNPQAGNGGRVSARGVIAMAGLVTAIGGPISGLVASATTPTTALVAAGLIAFVALVVFVAWMYAPRV